MKAADQGVTGDPAAAGDAVAVWLLALGQTLTYGCLYYVFAALIVTLESGTGWSKTMLAAGPTLALLLTAALAPAAGRMIDRGHGPAMLVAGPLIGAAGLVLAGLSATPAGWIAGWLLVGLAQAAALYETCFAFLTRRLGQGARAAITRVTLVAGFASTLAYPAGAWAGPMLGWQGAILAFALVQGAANGVASILRPVVTAELLGREGFGAISGAIAVAPLAGAALAPVLGAWLIEAGGAGLMLAACATLSLLSAAAAMALRRRLWP